MNTFTSKALLKKLRSKKKANGFTLIELMVVVAIVGILSAVGLPELTKAQNRAKDQTAVATLTNAAKECSLSLISLGNASEFNADNFKLGDNELGGTEGCAIDGDLSLASESGNNTATVSFSGGVPGTVILQEVTEG